MSIKILKTLPQYLIPQHGLTVCLGYFAGVETKFIKNYMIQNFIKKFHVNMKEALVEDPTSYACFNDFFIRHLKPECRPLAKADIVSPVDGSISEIGSIKEGQLLQAKGKYYSVKELLACDNEYANQYVNGQFATLYLSPKDYHRVHMPIDARLISMTYVPGALFSVKPSTTNSVPKLFSRNERLVLFFETEIGSMAIVLVGATIVGAIGTSFHGDIKRSRSNAVFNYNQQLKKGEELGYFKLGSTVIVLFANGEKIEWNKALTAKSSIRFGEAIGNFS